MKHLIGLSGHAFAKCYVHGWAWIMIMLPFAGFSQETACRLAGRVTQGDNEPLSGATVQLSLPETGFSETVMTAVNGEFLFAHLQPSAGYSIVVSHTGYQSLQVRQMAIMLGENQLPPLRLMKQVGTLQEVVVRGADLPGMKSYTGVAISRRMISDMPSPGRNLNDYIRYLPQASITANGGFSLAGQFFKYNAFFIDGANQSDAHGLAPNGISGGRTGTSPISIDALEEIQVLLDPYDVQYGNFTGGSINAVTRSGTNTLDASAWHYFRNEDLSGRSPVPVEKPGAPGETTRPRLTDFSSRITGIRAGGAIIRDKLFFFALAEYQDDEQPQPFSWEGYVGKANADSLAKLGNFLRSRYGYDAGTYQDNTETLEAARVMAKLDWRINPRHALSLAWRYFNANKTFVRGSNASRIFFSNSGFLLPSRNNALTAEWKFSKGQWSNRLLAAYVGKSDDQSALGQAFPLAIIRDGSARIQFGGSANSALNNLVNQSVSLFGVSTVKKEKHLVSFGTDNQLDHVYDVIIPEYFGSYQFASLNDFVRENRPVSYERSFPMNGRSVTDQNAPGARFSALRLGLFVHDRWSISDRFSLQAGIRLDYQTVYGTPGTDRFFNDSGRAKVEQYYPLYGAISGKLYDPYVQFSPRIGFRYASSDGRWQLRGGTGVFSGRIPLVWIATMFQNNGITIGSLNLRPPPAGFVFQPDPYRQPTPESLQIDNSNAKGRLELVTPGYKLPTVFRSSLALDKSFRGGWRLSAEGIFTGDIHGNTYTNVNILPPAYRSSQPGSRDIYAGSGVPDRIPMTYDGKNPYTGQVILLGNKTGKQGYAYSITVDAEKSWNGRFAMRAAYTYGDAMVFQDGTSGSNIDQWSSMETINGRNVASRSWSDYDMGHRIMATASRRFSYAKNRIATTVALFYNGQSGKRYSWVYLNSMVNDNGYLDNADLVYVPTAEELKTMNFQGNAAYSADQQKALLEEFITSDPYLRSRRGDFSERNGSRLPFTHILDLHLQQDFTVVARKNLITISIAWDISNLTNMLNPGWGRQWQMPGDNYKLLRFVGYKQGSMREPVYEYTPVADKPYTVQSSTNPWNSARWMSQLGLRVSVTGRKD